MTEPKVVRYDCFKNKRYPMQETPGGDWVPYSEANAGAAAYEALAARVRELEGQCRETNEILTDRNNDLFTERQENTRLAARVQELEEKCEDRLRSMESLNQCADREVVRKEAAWAENRRLREALND